MSATHAIGPRTPSRTVPVQLLAMKVTICWYALHGHDPDVVAEHRQRAPWYLTKTTLHLPTCSPSSAAPSSPPNFTPDKGQTPQPQEITQVHQAWAAAGLSTAKAELNYNRQDKRGLHRARGKRGNYYALADEPVWWYTFNTWMNSARLSRQHAPG